MTDSKEYRKSLRNHRKAIEKVIYEVKRLHPENCTPTLFAELKAGYLREMESHLGTLQSTEFHSKQIDQLLTVLKPPLGPDVEQEVLDILNADPNG